MAQEQLAGTNAITRLLMELKSFLASRFATKEELQDAGLGNVFQLYVDPEDMCLKGKPTGYGTFEVVDGYLILHQAEQ